MAAPPPVRCKHRAVAYLLPCVDWVAATTIIIEIAAGVHVD
jgi:hypothetical protein